jgi:hypothetical protein
MQTIPKHYKIIVQYFCCTKIFTPKNSPSQPEIVTIHAPFGGRCRRPLFSKNVFIQLLPPPPPLLLLLCCLSAMRGGPFE